MTLKRPVTLPQARRWPAAAARRESFCARMGGMRKKLTGERAARDPRSKINQALAAWDCDEAELLQAKHVSKGIRPMKITQKMVGAEANPMPKRREPALSGEDIRRMMKQARVTIPELASRMYITQARVRFVRERGVSGGNYVRDWIQGITGTDPGPIQNPARKPIVSQKISQLTREGYPQKQAVAIALSEQRAGKVRANPAMAKLYTVHTVTGDGKPRDPIAHFRKRSDALTYAKAYAKAYGAPVVLTSKAL